MQHTIILACVRMVVTAAEEANRRHGRGRLVSSRTAFSTASAWPGTFTLRQIFAILPRGSTRNVDRSTPMYFRPYMDFSTQTPYAVAADFEQDGWDDFLAADNTDRIYLMRNQTITCGTTGCSGTTKKAPTVTGRSLPRSLWVIKKVT